MARFVTPPPKSAIGKLIARPMSGRWADTPEPALMTLATVLNSSAAIKGAVPFGVVAKLTLPGLALA